MRKVAAWLLLVTLILSACSKPKPPSTPPASQPNQGGDAPSVTPPGPLPEGPDLTAVKGPYDLPIDELIKGLYRYLAQGQGTVAGKLNRLYAQWRLLPTELNLLLAEADLNGDGSLEVVTALNGAGGVTGEGALLVIQEQNGQVAIDRSAEPLPGVALFRVQDLAGDGGLEIIWSSTNQGAHTATAQVMVSRWQPGRLADLPGLMSSTNLKLGLEGKDLLLMGGTIGSAGAGMAQRVRTDRYRWADDGFRLVDQRYGLSSFAYHRLQDGIVAEEFGHRAEAEQAYREAAEEARPVLAPEMAPPEAMAQLGHAVRAFALFRLGGLLKQDGRADQGRAELLAAATGSFGGLVSEMARAESREAGCRAAEDWAKRTPAFLEGLASPFGYANPRWQADTLCGPMPPIE